MPLAENLTQKIPLSNAYSAKQCVESLYRLEHLAHIADAEIIPSHDISVYDIINKSPSAL